MASALYFALLAYYANVYRMLTIEAVARRLSSNLALPVDGMVRLVIDVSAFAAGPVRKVFSTLAWLWSGWWKWIVWPFFGALFKLIIGLGEAAFKMPVGASLVTFVILCLLRMYPSVFWPLDFVRHLLALALHTFFSVCWSSIGFVVVAFHFPMSVLCGIFAEALPADLSALHKDQPRVTILLSFAFVLLRTHVLFFAFDRVRRRPEVAVEPRDVFVRTRDGRFVRRT